MNSNTSRLRPPTTWLLALVLGTSSLVACAQPGTGPMAGPGSAQAQDGRRGEPMERMQAWQARRLADLKAKLKLTPAQEGAWTSYTQVLQAWPAHTAQHAQQRQDLMQLSTPERIDRMKVLRAQHQSDMNAYMDRRGEATKTFYATLTPEQKQVFDAETARLMEGGKGRGHDRHGPHHGMMPGGRS